YRYGRAGLKEAEGRLVSVWRLSGELKADSPKGLSKVWELRERLAVSRLLVAHLAERRETRWPGFGEYADCPGTDSSQELFVNSRIPDPPLIPPEDLARHPPEMLARPLDRPPGAGDAQGGGGGDGGKGAP
ncbi:MAG: hypothetical protein LBQ12_15640, partial [Deltaproteobacteria bacterium]|nr:hypothetical protein [Deltaproteobacteria bacterium]